MRRTAPVRPVETQDFASPQSDTPVPEYNPSVWQRLVEWLHKQKGYDPKRLTDPEPRAAIEETRRILAKPLGDLAITQDIPEELTATLNQNIFFFSGFKTHHELVEASRMLKGEDGNFKPFQQFLKDVETIDKVYNRNYLQAEYNFATASTQMAVKWKEWEQEGDRYHLQYRTAGDSRVREEHAALDGITLPPSDPFWNSYLPPNGWNCRCTAVQVRQGKYPRSDSAAAMAAGANCTDTPKKQIFRFNPGKQEKIFPPKHPYFPKGCGDCQYKRLIFDNEKAICKACLKVDAASVKWSRDVVREHYEKVAKNDIILEIGNTHLDKLTFSVKDIKNITGKPHDYPYARNMATYYLKHIAQKSDYLGYSDDIKPDNPKHSGIVAWRYFSFDFLGSKSILIVKEYEDGTLRPHHIQDSNHFKKEKIKYPFK